MKMASSTLGPMVSLITNMIIQIDSSAYDFCVNENDHNARYFLDDLCSSRKLGYIALDSTKKIILAILNRSDLSPLQKAIINNIKEMITFKLSLFERVKFRAIVFNSKFGFDKSRYDDTNLFIDLNDYYNRYTRNGINPFNKPKLVLEDINDYNVYNYICRWYKNNNTVFIDYNISLDIEHGGGNRTSNICEQYFSDGKTVFSICDSDSKYPGDPKKHDTASNLIELFSSKINLNQLYVLKCQEVENLIPLSILKETANGTQLPAVKFIEHVIDQDPEYYFFIDLKNGFKYNQVFPEVETEYSKHWSKFFEDFDCEHYNRSVLSVRNKTTPKNSSIICKLSSMLPHAIDRMKSMPIDTEIEPYLLAEWKNIAEKLYSWGCSGKQLRVF